MAISDLCGDMNSQPSRQISAMAMTIAAWAITKVRTTDGPNSASMQCMTHDGKGGCFQ
jgi:hypothetical protein